MRRPTQVTAALAIWAAGAVHLYLWDAESYRSIHVIGPLFLLNGVAAAVIGAVLLVTTNPLVLGAGIGYSATTLIAFAISVENGLFGWKETWPGTAQEVAAGTELASLVLLLALSALNVRPLHPASSRRERPSVARAAR